jgi:hypothetical protein
LQDADSIAAQNRQSSVRRQGEASLTLAAAAACGNYRPKELSD